MIGVTRTEVEKILAYWQDGTLPDGLEHDCNDPAVDSCDACRWAGGARGRVARYLRDTWDAVDNGLSRNWAKLAPAQQAQVRHCVRIGRIVVARHSMAAARMQQLAVRGWVLLMPNNLPSLEGSVGVVAYFPTPAAVAQVKAEEASA